MMHARPSRGSAGHAGWFVAAAALLLFAWPAPLAAQNNAVRPAPRIGYIYPAGGQQGTTFTVSIGGQNLTGATAVHVFGVGVRTKLVGYDRPMTQKEINDLRMKVSDLQEKRAKGKLSASEQKALNDARAKLAKRPNRTANPAIAETITLEVTLAADAPLGERDVRVQTGGGLSNPLTFAIGQLREFGAPVVTGTMMAQRARDAKSPPVNVTLPALVNGQILPGEVDRVRFTARQGQRLTVVANARSLIPFLADAVPGWFQATIALYNAAGREIAYADDYRYNPDPVLGYDVPADGDYTLEIKDAIYRGREDFVYRVAIGELPFITGIFPLGGQAGRDLMFELTGWNLPSNRLKYGAKDSASGTFVLTVRNQDALSNAVRFAVDAAPEYGPSNEDSGELLALPATLNGRIERPGDEDVFRLQALPGSAVVAEVFARRLSSPLDSVLEATDLAGQRLALNDDYEDKGVGLLTHHADSRVTFNVPADGKFLLRLRDTQHQGGTDYAYRIRVDAPHPDFALRVVPSSINVRAGTSVPITVYALRRDGFAGEIQLGLEDAPKWIALSGPRIPAGQDKVQLTLTVAAVVSREGPFNLSLVGLAKIGEGKVARRATPAEDMMQAFAYHHLVPVRELKVAIGARANGFRVASRMPAQLAAGKDASIRIELPYSRFATNMHFELIDPPEGISVRDGRMSGVFLEAILVCDPTKAKPGLEGNLVLNVSGERVGSGKKAARNGPRVPLGVVPAIPFQVVAGPSFPVGQ